uniref:RNA silencing suppressor n=2 Tax=Potato virus M TaxID=12167 RepID=A0A286R823_9VIRU|nr:nulceic acid binding protein [Potato virus M]
MKCVTRTALLVARAMYLHSGVFAFDLAYAISKCAGRPLGGGKSKYARLRRAISAGRCHRCYRLWPPTSFTTRCDNRSCFPGIHYNVRVAQFIDEGVTEVIPSVIQKNE